MGKILFLFLFLPTIISAQSERDIILSEIMFAPQSGNNEFIELYNTSETESIDLSSYKIKYQTSNPDIFESTGSGTILPPESFAVIFEGDYDLSSGIYKDLVPSSALVLKTGDNSFGSSGMSNSSDRTLLLMNYMDEILET
ncbi:MAG: lamin tail domain-containing protein, partial [Ignavibacteriaceae bacterium]